LTCNLFSLVCAYSSIDLYFVNIDCRSAILLLIGAFLTTTALVTIHPHPIQAETGKGKDVFKVIMTIFGVDESKGDVVAIVTAKDEQAKVKLFDASGPEVVPLNATEGGGHLIEYVATFPNLTVNSGDEYKACVATVKDLELICKSGNNSPAARPEFVDLSLNATGSNIEQVTVEEENSGEEEVRDETDETDETEEENNVSPGMPPTG
jgi:hypothetical protein